MSATLTRGQSKAVSPADTNCVLLVAADSRGYDVVVVYSCDQPFYLVNNPATADAAALPAEGIKGPFQPADCPVEVRLPHTGRALLRLAAAGTAQVEIH